MIVKFFGKKVLEIEKDIPPAKLETEHKPAKAEAYGAGGGFGRASRTVWRYFDGEKSVGGMGPITRYTVDYNALRMRSWQLLLESEIVQIAINRSVVWGVGKKLRLRCQPDKNILESKGINTNNQKFNKQVEGLWNLFADSCYSSYSNMVNFHEIVREAEKNAIMGGDCLFIVNVIDGIPKAEIKDGQHIRTPIFATGLGIDTINPKTGNRIRHGIEIDKKGEHVAFFVCKADSTNGSVIDYMNYERVPAKDEYGNLRAFMYYGIRYRIDDIRGIPLIAVCMETTKQMELYKEATVSGAVERAKLVFTIEHELGAIGTNPFDANLARGLGNPIINNGSIPVDINGQAIADTFAATTGRSAVNLPVGAKAKNLGQGPESQFGEFYDTNLKIVFAALEIPFEVALMMFGSNYSASRAAIKDWEHTLEVRRERRIQIPYQKMFEIFFLCQVLNSEIQAPGYLDAFRKKNFWVMAAYTSATWRGDRVPNIDEKKEVDATRAMLGAGSTHMPIISIEDAMDRHGTNDFVETTEQYSDELEFGDDMGIEKVESKGTVIEDFDDPNEDKKGKPATKNNDGKTPSGGGKKK